MAKYYLTEEENQSSFEKIPKKKKLNKPKETSRFKSKLSKEQAE